MRCSDEVGDVADRLEGSTCNEENRGSVFIRDIIQYNWSLISPFFLMHARLRSALSRLGSTDAIVMRNIEGKELAKGPRRFESHSRRRCGILGKSYTHSCL